MGHRNLLVGALTAPLLLVGVLAAPPSQAVPHAPAAGPRLIRPHAHTAGQATPPRVRGLAVYQDGSTVTLAWHNPARPSIARIIVRFARGSHAPRTPRDGKAVRLPAGRTTTAAVSGLAADTTYSAAVWVRDQRHRLSKPAPTTFTTADPINRRRGELTGIVTDREQAALSGVVVTAVDYTTFAMMSTVTDANGHYTLTVPASPHLVAFDGADGQGGDSDATGYQSTYAAATVPAAGTATSDAALRPGAAVTGRITDPDGNPVAGVSAYPAPILPYVWPDLGGGAIIGIYEGADSGSTSAADGTFTLKGLAHRAFIPCFDPTTPDVSGGIGDGSGYTRRCLSSPLLLSAGSSQSVGNVVLQPHPGGSVRGVVRDSTGRGIAFANVFVYPVGKRSAVGYAGAGEDGRYRLDGLAPGMYRVCASSFPWPGAGAGAGGVGYAPRCRRQQVSVTQGQVSDADVVLAPGGAASGTVTTSSGLPVTNAEVEVQQVNGRAGGFAVTDSRGHWTVVGLRSGNYDVCVNTMGSRTPGAAYGVIGRCFPHRQPVRVVQGRNRIDVEIQLRPGSGITGRIVDATGQPLAEAAAVAYSDSGSYPAFASTGPNGYYVLANLPPGAYHVCGLAYGGGTADSQHCLHAVVARRSHLTRHVDFSFPLRGSVQVSVHDQAGHPLAGVDAAALTPCRRFCDRIPILGRRVRVAASRVTRVNGTVVLGALRPGSYALCAFGYDAGRTDDTPPTGYADACASSAFDVTVRAGEQSDVSVTLPLAGEVTGTVTDSAGNPLRHVRVWVSGSAAADARGQFDGPGGGGDPTSDNVTSADGTYAVRSVAAGDQTVCFDASHARGGTDPAGYLSQCIGGAPGGKKGTPVPVTAGRVIAGQDIVLTGAGGISGSVTDATGTRPGRWAFVDVFRAGTEREIAEAQVGKGGNYRVSSLRSGDYLVCFQAEGYQSECYDDQPWTGGPLPSGATSVTVTAGAVTPGVDAVLQKP